MNNREPDWLDRLIPYLPEPNKVDRFIVQFALVVVTAVLTLALFCGAC